MPAYEFRCEGCGSFELMRSFSDVPHPVFCPACGSRARRVFTPPGLVKTAVPLTRALDRAHKSTSQPEVVTRQIARGDQKNPTTTVHSQHGRPWQIGH